MTRAELIERAVREALFPEEMQGTMSCKRRDTCPQCQDLLTRVRSAFARLTSGADSVGSGVATICSRETLDDTRTLRQTQADPEAVPEEQAP